MENHARKPAICLLSGGLDSATTLAIAIDEGYDAHCVSFSYGQRHTIELECAARVADALGASSHRIVDLDTSIFAGASALTGGSDVPKDRESSSMDDIPSTYVPARNLIFLSIAAGIAESIGARDLYIGANAVDYSGYPDCRTEFLESFQTTLNLGTKAGVSGDTTRLHAPLVHLTKAQIIERGTALGVDYALTHSCYDPDDLGRACGRCDSCVLRREGFARAGVNDPTPYTPGAIP
jgi:7-cyano-7-deazaguanine synthase